MREGDQRKAKDEGNEILGRKGRKKGKSRQEKGKERQRQVESEECWKETKKEK